MDEFPDLKELDRNSEEVFKYVKDIMDLPPGMAICTLCYALGLILARSPSPTLDLKDQFNLLNQSILLSYLQETKFKDM